MEQVYEQELAKEIQLFEGRLTVIYSGSRGTFLTSVSQVFEIVHEAVPRNKSRLF